MANPTPTASDPTKAALWRICRIFLGLDLDATNVPATIDDPFDSTWIELGLLAKGGPQETPAWGQNTKLYARNGELVRTYEDEFSLTVDFGMLEVDGEGPRALVWPGSTETEVYVPRPAHVKLGFEYEEVGKRERLITPNYAKASINGGITKAENALASYPVRAEIFPDLNETNDDGEPLLWTRQLTTVSS